MRAMFADPTMWLIFGGAVLAAFALGRTGRSLWLRWRKPVPEAEPPLSRQMRRARRRRADKRWR